MDECDVCALDLTLPASTNTPGRVRRAVGEVADGRIGDVEGLRLAVSEAVTNAVVHAYRDRPTGAPPGIVHVRAWFADGELLISVSDEGVGMKPREDSPGAGVGLALMAQLADRLEIHQRPVGTRLVLHFRTRPSSCACSVPRAR